MSGFESLVRPFTTTDTAPDPGLATVPTPVDNAVLIATGAGQVKSGNYSLSFSISYYADAQHMELEDFLGSGAFAVAAGPVRSVPRNTIEARAMAQQLGAAPREPGRQLAQPGRRGRWFVRY